ncbi:hypothetical protein RhiJN_25256 [Ceratobasidium sp. AG-Ba]|nr:hypothetical protein RhiJN_25256 [Ceratobasidium sp. AG-Ba]
MSNLKFSPPSVAHSPTRTCASSRSPSVPAPDPRRLSTGFHVGRPHAKLGAIPSECLAPYDATSTGESEMIATKPCWAECLPIAPRPVPISGLGVESAQSRPNIRPRAQTPGLGDVTLSPLSDCGGSHARFLSVEKTVHSHSVLFEQASVVVGYDGSVGLLRLPGFLKGASLINFRNATEQRMRIMIRPFDHTFTTQAQGISP